MFTFFLWTETVHIWDPVAFDSLHITTIFIDMILLLFPSHFFFCTQTYKDVDQSSVQGNLSIQESTGTKENVQFGRGSGLQLILQQRYKKSS